MAKCKIAVEAREWILKWCGLPIIVFDNVLDLINYAANWSNCPRKRERFTTITYGLMWYTWVARNDMVFNKTRNFLEKIVG